MRRGAASPDGYYLDSHQLESIVGDLLLPFASGASSVQTSAFDEPSDSDAVSHVDVGDAATMVFDGLFLHRSELASFWHVSVYLDADERRDREWLNYLLDELPRSATERARALDERLRRARWPRYRDGWQRYLDEVHPIDLATVVIDNNDFAAPRLR